MALLEGVWLRQEGVVMQIDRVGLWGRGGERGRGYKRGRAHANEARGVVGGMGAWPTARWAWPWGGASTAWPRPHSFPPPPPPRFVRI